MVPTSRSEKLISTKKFILDLLVYAARDIDQAGIGNVLQARSNVDAITVNFISFDDNVAKIDANPILDPMMLRQRGVAASDDVLLNDDTASHGFDRTVENRDKTVAVGFDEPSMVLGNARLDEIALDPLDATVRSFFIEFHQAAVASDIASDNRHQTAR